MRILRLLPLFAAACGGEPDASPREAAPDLTTHDGVTEAHIEAMEDMADVLDGIHDRQSAEAARPRMEAIKKRMEAINVAEARLPAPAPDERERVEARLEEAAKALEPQFERTMERLKGDPSTLVLVAKMMIDVTFETRR